MPVQSHHAVDTPQDEINIQPAMAMIGHSYNSVNQLLATPSVLIRKRVSEVYIFALLLLKVYILFFAAIYFIIPVAHILSEVFILLLLLYL